ncbi:adenylosuccinate lyase [Gaetbulibacter sp. M235]|uniref:adenylosuccinate lyase n=1 Tax=Gaetbulibacter sp. M235 TaxID=3126510 RepID=UPI00374F2DB8
MTLEELHKELSYINALRENRVKFAKLVLNDLSLLPKLIAILFMVDDKVSCKAAWVFEFVCDEYIYAIIPYLDEFTSNINKVHFDSAVRPVAKVCEFLAKTYYSKQPNTIKKTLLPKHKELIIENCFDWMIRDEKIAVKAFAMNTLYLFGKDYKWIHPELVQILEQDFQNQSPGYKARAKHILKKIKAKK